MYTFKLLKNITVECLFVVQFYFCKLSGHFGALVQIFMEFHCIETPPLPLQEGGNGHCLG